MSDLTEKEIADRMVSSLKEAIDACGTLATSSLRGAAYNKLREHLLLIEGCCRQLSAFREDSTWLPIGQMMAECHRRAGGWLRGYRNRDGIKVMMAPGQLNEMFVMLGANLGAILVGVQEKYTAATGKRGPILPEVKFERRIGAPVSMSNLILPSAYRKVG